MFERNAWSYRIKKTGAKQCWNEDRELEGNKAEISKQRVRLQSMPHSTKQIFAAGCRTFIAEESGVFNS